MKNRRFSAFLIIFFLLNTVFAQTSNKSTATITSDSLFFTFDQLGLHPKKQLLSGSLSPDFPYNIIVPFKNNTNKFYENSLTILFSQSYSIQYINEFLNLFEYLQSNQIMHFDISFVFTANDQNATHSLSGTKTYANSIPKKNKTFVLCLDYNENHKKDTVLITPGGRTSTGKGSLCPRSVMDTTIETCYSANLPFSIQGRFLPLYRLGFFNMSPRLSHILEEEFPAIAITLNKENEQAIFSFLENLCAQSLEWDSTTSEIHYSVIKLPRHAVFFSERAYIVLLILSAAITLFLSFGLSFIKGAHSYIHRKEFAKSWPIIPIAVLITAIFLIPIQKITGIITATSYINPISFLLLETSFAFLFVMLFSFIQYVFNLPMTGFIYGFLLTIVSFLNIFIFATIDIALISLFIIEYIIIYTTRKTRNVWAIIGITILMTLPFIPYLYQIAKYADAHVNNLIVHSSFSVHVLYAWIIVPFEIMMIRIAVRLKIWGRHPSITRKKRIIQVAVVLLIIIVLIMSTFVRKKLILHTTEENIDIKNKTDSVLTLNCSHENLFERQCAQMYIESKTPILRYEIIARSKNPLPILEANYPYDMLTAPCIALFNIDECPPNPLKLTFTYNAKYDVMYEIEAFYTIQDVLYSEKKEYVFPKLKEESP